MVREKHPWQVPDAAMSNAERKAEKTLDVGGMCGYLLPNL